MHIAGIAKPDAFAGLFAQFLELRFGLFDAPFALHGEVAPLAHVCAFLRLSVRKQLKTKERVPVLNFCSDTLSR
jgi:hypothetical protein